MRAALACTFGALASALACAPTAAPAAPTSRPAASSRPSSASSLDDALAEDMASERGMPWSHGRRLLWSDFQGRPPQGGNEGARTAYGLYYAWSCHDDVFTFRVIAALHPLRSWVKPVVVDNVHESARVLRHEQTHFDITEVHARRMRQRFGTLSAACAKTDGELRALARQLVEAEKEMQRRYDRETNHGLVAPRQTAWSADVAGMLARASGYAR